LDIAGIVPCHEDLVRAWGVAKHLRPCAGCLLALLPPEFAEFGIERVPMDLEVFDQLRRYSGGEGLFGRRGVVAAIAEDADLVLYLHHDDCVFADIDLANVLHDRGEGSGVGVAGGI